jgi:peptide/nickel transport system substrate-binding protein
MMPPGTDTSTRRVRSLRTAGRAVCLVLLGVFGAGAACTAPVRTPGTAVMASGTDLESGNPLVTVHPLSRQVQRHALFVTLVRLDSALQPVPYFARRWTWDADHRAVTLHLDSTLRWHDGHLTTADDVAFTLEAAADADLGSPRRGDVAVVRRGQVLDRHAIRLEFTEPQAALPPILAELPLVPRHLLDSVPRARWRAHPFATAPVGNGPFRFAARVAGRQWRFVRNPDFPAALGGPPTLQQLVVAVVDEAATKFAGLVSGELDLAGVSPTMAPLVQQDSALFLETPPALFSTVLAFNTTRAPFDDERVRRAVSLAVDRQRVVDAAVAGFGTPATSALPPGLPVTPPPVARVTPAAREDALRQADSLLDAAGWRRTATRDATGGVRTRSGTPLRVTLLTVGSGEMAVEQLVQADLAARGIDVAIRVLELATFLATVRRPDKSFDVVLTGIPGDMALGHLSALFAGAQRGGALDYTGFHTSTLDSALARARRAAPDQAPAAWAAVDRQLATDMPVVWLYHARGVQGRARRLVNVHMDLRGELVTVARWERQDAR